MYDSRTKKAMKYNKISHLDNKMYDIDNVVKVVKNLESFWPKLKAVKIKKVPNVRIWVFCENTFLINQSRLNPVCIYDKHLRRPGRQHLKSPVVCGKTTNRKSSFYYKQK